MDKNQLSTDRKSIFLSVHLPLIAVQFLFAMLPTFGKIAFKTFPPMLIAFFRISVTAVLFYLIFRLFAYEKLQKKIHLLHFAIFALFGVSANQLLFLKGLSMTNASNATMLMSIIPILTLIVAVIAGHERMRLIRIAGILVAFAGAAYIVGFANLEFSTYFKGNLLIIINATCYAIYLVISKPILQIYRSLTVITYIFVFGFIEIIPVTIGEVRFLFENSIPAELWLAPVYVVFCGTFLPYLLNTIALKGGKSSLVAVYIYLQPVIGVIFASILLKEKLSVMMIVAGILVLAGVTLVSFEKIIREFVKSLTSKVRSVLQH